MNYLEIAHTYLITTGGIKLPLIDPKIKFKRGIISISGFLNTTEVNKASSGSPNPYKWMETQLGFDREGWTDTFENHMQIVGIGSFGSKVTISEVLCSRIQYSNLRVEFYTHNHLLHEISLGADSPDEKDDVTSICIEGLSMQFYGTTSYYKTRSILNTEKKFPVSTKWNFSEFVLDFQFQNQKHHHHITLIKEDESTYLTFEKAPRMELDVYEKLKIHLRAFLSYPTGNTLQFREEHFQRDGKIYSRINSVQTVKSKVYSEYIPINEVSFRNKGVLSDYLSCFDRFLKINQHLDLIGFIFLFNQSRKVALDTSVFIMLVALEKLADDFINSSLVTDETAHIINPDDFSNRMTTVNAAFVEAFKGINRTAFNALKSKLGNLNTQAKTNRKIDALLDFVEIPIQDSIRPILHELRNRAIHQGEVELLDSSGTENFMALTHLCHEVCCNLIQYPGYRFIERKERKNYVEQKREYKFDFAKLEKP